MAKRKIKRKNRKKPNCSSKSFSCGFSCQPRKNRDGSPRVCRSNVDEKGNKLVETYSQFLSRVTTGSLEEVSLDSQIRSALNNENSDQPLFMERESLAPSKFRLMGQTTWHPSFNSISVASSEPSINNHPMLRNSVELLLSSNNFHDLNLPKTLFNEFRLSKFTKTKEGFEEDLKLKKSLNSLEDLEGKTIVSHILKDRARLDSNIFSVLEETTLNGENLAIVASTFEDGEFRPYNKEKDGAMGSTERVKALKIRQDLYRDMDAQSSNDLLDLDEEGLIPPDRFTEFAKDSSLLEQYYSEEISINSDKVFNARTSQIGELNSIERIAYNRPTPTNQFTEEKLRSDAQKWAQAQGFDPNEGANGFSSEQTAAHDIAHPAMHALTGLNTPKIKELYKTDSLAFEEGIVNMVEQLSRGVPVPGAILNAIRLTRVLLRSDRESPEYKTASSMQYADSLTAIADKIMRNGDYEQIMDVVRKNNKISGTVLSSGYNFNNTASGN